MKSSVFVAVAVLACAATVALGATNPNCDPSYECQYKYTTPDLSATYSFDFSHLCAATDFELQDAAEHTYYANVCGTAQHNCLPGAFRPHPRAIHVSVPHTRAMPQHTRRAALSSRVPLPPPRDGT